MIDLHCHSNFSDGLLDPLSLVKLAINAQLEFFALTDHDTVMGLEQLPNVDNLIIIPGIELSTHWNGHDIHVIGLNIDKKSDNLTNLIDLQAQRRTQRAYKIGQQLENIGIKDAYLKAFEIAGHARLGRPHFAQVLIKEGKAYSLKEAFKRYLLKGQVGYTPSNWPNLVEVITAIKNAKGQAVIAHPKRYKMGFKILEQLIQEFKAAGGQGLEVVSGVTENKTMRQMAAMCLKYDLWASSGSDFHGMAHSLPLGHQAKLPPNCKPIWHQWR